MKEIGRTRSGLQMGYTTGSCAAAAAKAAAEMLLSGEEIRQVRLLTPKGIDLGFSGKHLIAMQGPFSREMNLALLHQTEAKYFVTKESGKNGGFAEKLEAAEQAGAVLLVIGRPIEEGLSVEEAEQEMRKWNRD